MSHIQISVKDDDKKDFANSIEKRISLLADLLKNSKEYNMKFFNSMAKNMESMQDRRMKSFEKSMDSMFRFIKNSTSDKNDSLISSLNKLKESKNDDYENHHKEMMDMMKGSNSLMESMKDMMKMDSKKEPEHKIEKQVIVKTVDNRKINELIDAMKDSNLFRKRRIGTDLMPVAM